MFRVSKIMNSGTNQPELFRLPTRENESYLVGTPLIMTAGMLTSPTNSETPEYIAAESASANEKSELLCYKVNDDMIFEATLTSPLSDYTIGKNYPIQPNDYGQGIGVIAADGDGPALLVGLGNSDDQFKNIGYIRFIKYY